MEKYFQELLDSFTQKLGISEVVVDADNQCNLEIDGFLLLLRRVEVDETLLMAVVLAPLKGSNIPDLYRILLQGQYFFHLTRGASLSVDLEENFVCLQHLENLRNLAKDDFLQLIERFIQTARYWRQKCWDILGQSQADNVQSEMENVLSGPMMRV
jgi:hypothetical protein